MCTDIHCMQVNTALSAVEKIAAALAGKSESEIADTLWKDIVCKAQGHDGAHAMRTIAQLI